MSVRTHISSTSGPRTSACIDPLRCRSSASGYRNVYFAKKDRNGVAIYVARVKRGGALMTLRGSRSPQPHKCAEHVARWYEREFGPDWAEVLAARKLTPWALVAAGGAWKACVWVEGAREWVTVTEKRPRNAWKVTGRVALFPTRAAAREGIAVYLARAYGLFGPLLLHRRGAVRAAR